MPKPDSFNVDGLDMDPETRCGHYHGPNDVLAIQLACCDVYYACRECHDALAGHAAKIWPADQFEAPALLCGRCRRTFSIHAYLDSPTHCPNCNGAFNPNCRLHHHLYFDVQASG